MCDFNNSNNSKFSVTDSGQRDIKWITGSRESKIAVQNNLPRFLRKQLLALNFFFGNQSSFIGETVSIKRSDWEIIPTNEKLL